MGRSMRILAILVTLLFLAPLAGHALASKQYTVTPGGSPALVLESDSGAIPSIDKSAPENYGLNIGPGFPAVVLANSSDNVILVLRVPEANKTVDIAAARVELIQGKLYYVKHYLAYQVINDTAIRLISPGEGLEPGLYDIIVYTSDNKTLPIPQSLWVVDPAMLARNFTFMHITDVHFGAGTPNITVGQDRRFTGYLLSQLLGVDAIINTGDEADTSSANQYQNSLSYRYMLAYSVPMFLNPGNHDYPNKNFILYYGDTLRYVVIGGKILIVAINTDGEVGHADQANLTFLENVLSQHRSVPIKIVIMHHPVFYYQGVLNLTYNSSSPLLSDPNENRDSALSFYWGADLNATREFLRIIEEYNVTMVLAGHIHRDQYVLYHSTWTGHDTYFQTTTTLAHGTGTYQGFQVVSLNLTTGKPSYPLAPPWFIGYENHNRKDVYNSIPLTLPRYAGHWKPEFDDTYLYGWHAQGRTGLVFALYNMLPYLTINKTVILALPWPDGYDVNFKVLNAENASAKLVGYLYVEELHRAFVAIHFDMKPKSMLELVLFTEPDHEPPSITLKRTIPRSPAINKPIKAYINVQDDGWGVESVTANATVDRGVLQDFKFSKLGSGTYIAEFRVNSKYRANITITVTATDYAGNTNTTNITISLAGPVPPVNTTTSTTPPAGQTNTTTPPGTTTSTTTPPETTTITTTETASPPGGTSTETAHGGGAGMPSPVLAGSNTHSSSTGKPESTGRLGLVAGIVVVVIVVAAALFLMKK